jgi:type IV pilus assembly protein PilO
MDKYLDQLQKTPMGQKAALVIMLVVGMSAANWYFAIDPIETHLTQLAGEQQKLDGDLTQKQTIANNLNQFKREKEQLEQQLAQATTELPTQADIDELLRQLNDVAKKAGLEITSVTPQGEAAESFFVRIPIAMSVAGSYEEIAVFFESVSRLRRIVNISNVSLDTPTKKSEKVLLKATFSATTFRFNSNSVAPPAK